MSHQARKLSLIVFVSALVLESSAYANAGVPMLGVVWPLAWGAFVPIVLIEAAVGRRLTTMSWQNAIFGSLGANVMSTLFGIPLTWLVLTVAEMVFTAGGTSYGLQSPLAVLLAVTVQAPWLVPYESELEWMIPAATTFLLPIFGLVSVYVEKRAFAKITGCEKSVAKKWAWRANLITYGIAIAASLVWLLIRLSWYAE
jgi:hypothetical protein